VGLDDAVAEVDRVPLRHPSPLVEVVEPVVVAVRRRDRRRPGVRLEDRAGVPRVRDVRTGSHPDGRPRGSPGRRPRRFVARVEDPPGAGRRERVEQQALLASVDEVPALRDVRLPSLLVPVRLPFGQAEPLRPVRPRPVDPVDPGTISRPCHRVAQFGGAKSHRRDARSRRERRADGDDRPAGGRTLDLLPSRRVAVVRPEVTAGSARAAARRASGRCGVESLRRRVAAPSGASRSRSLPASPGTVHVPARSAGPSAESGVVRVGRDRPGVDARPVGSRRDRPFPPPRVARGRPVHGAVTSSCVKSRPHSRQR
jgi:hypothetical protein